MYDVYVIGLRSGKIYPNKEGRVEIYKEGRVENFQHESLTKVVCQTLYYPGKNHANMFSNALALLETLFLRGMSLPWTPYPEYALIR